MSVQVTVNYGNRVYANKSLTIVHLIIINGIFCKWLHNWTNGHSSDSLQIVIKPFYGFHNGASKFSPPTTQILPVTYILDTIMLTIDTVKNGRGDKQNVAYNKIINVSYFCLCWFFSEQNRSLFFIFRCTLAMMWWLD